MFQEMFKTTENSMRKMMAMPHLSHLPLSGNALPQGLMAALPALSPGRPHKLVGQSLSRSVSNVQNLCALTLTPQAVDGSLFADWLAMCGAIAKRMQAQQAEFVTGLKEIAVEVRRIDEANTYYKLVGQECNIMGQWNALVSSQLMAMMLIVENAEIGWTYLLAQKVKAAA